MRNPNCKDLTAYEALRNVEAEEKAEARYKKITRYNL